MDQHIVHALKRDTRDQAAPYRFTLASGLPAFLGRQARGLVLLAGLSSGVLAAQLPPDFFTRASPALAVNPSAEADNSFSGLVDGAGGELIAEADDGTVFTLRVPRGALVMPTRLTITPLRAVGNLPFKAGLLAGAKLEPDGQWFLKPVTLEIKPGKPVNLKTLTPFTFHGAGEAYSTTVLTSDPSRLAFVLNHFSGYGVGNSTPQEQAAALVKPALDAEDRLAQANKEAISRERQGKMLGADDEPSSFPKDVQDNIREYGKQVLGPLEKAAAQSCSVAALYMQSVIGLERQSQMLGVDEAHSTADFHDLTGTSPLGKAIALRCLKEEFEVCVKNGGDVVRLAQWKIGWERQRQLLGVDEASDPEVDRAFEEAVKRCGRYEVEVNSGLQDHGKVDAWGGLVFAGPTTYDYDAFLQARVPVQTPMKPAAGLLLPELPLGSAPLEYVRYTTSSQGSVGIVISQDASGTNRGFEGDCTLRQNGSRSGVLTVTIQLVYKDGPPQRQPLQVPSIQTIIDRLPKVGLLRPPRILDLNETRLYVNPGDPTELTRRTCRMNTGQVTTEDGEDRNWLGEWHRELGEPSGEDTAEGGWELRPLEPASNGLLRFRQSRRTTNDIGAHVWELEVTLKHTPQR